jgi:flagellar hook-basal body complex protein FliE
MVNVIIGGDRIPPGLETGRSGPAGQKTGTSFKNALKDAAKEINELQAKADRAIERVEVDNSASIHEAMIALEKADISFKAMMQVRNKIMEAYQEIMRMQV